MLKAIPKDYFDGSRGTLKLLWEDEWRGLGITQVREKDRDDSIKRHRFVFIFANAEIFWGGYRV